MGGDAGTHTSSEGSSLPGSPGSPTPVAAPRSSPVPPKADGRCNPHRGPAWRRAASGPWAKWPPEYSHTCGPYCGQCPISVQFPGSNGRLSSCRISLSRLPPLTISVHHLHGISLDDAFVLRWVNSISAIPLIITLTLTPSHISKTAVSTVSGGADAASPAAIVSRQCQNAL